jgi:glycosyltransferase involved in cell wall biosynthesis
MRKNHNKGGLSVIMVSDFEPGETKSWKDEQLLLESLAQQDIEEDFELILVESSVHRDEGVPEFFYDSFPNLKVVYFDSEQSAKLKDYGVSLSSGEYIAVIESDCQPSPNWLRMLLKAVRENAWAISSALCIYGEATSYQRVMSLLDRSWRDLGQSGEAEGISNNGAMYQRKVLEEYPYPDAVTPFLSAQERNTRILKAGYHPYFEREATMIHALGGWDFLWDLHENKGHQIMASSKQQSFRSIPKLLLRKTRKDLGNCRRLGKDYLKWYDWPLYVVLLLSLLLPKFVGMTHALAKVNRIPKTAYR